MPDSFVPLMPAIMANHGPSFASFAGNGNGKATSHAGAKSAETSNSIAAASAPKSGACATKPKITLQRNGDIISAIRIQCGCGEVVELTCVY